jgi:hypothetical protein
VKKLFQVSSLFILSGQEDNIWTLICKQFIMQSIVPFINTFIAIAEVHYNVIMKITSACGHARLRRVVISHTCHTSMGGVSIKLHQTL